MCQIYRTPHQNFIQSTSKDIFRLFYEFSRFSASKQRNFVYRYPQKQMKGFANAFRMFRIKVIAIVGSVSKSGWTCWNFHYSPPFELHIEYRSNEAYLCIFPNHNFCHFYVVSWICRFENRPLYDRRCRKSDKLQTQR